MLDVYERAISALKKLVEALPGDSLTVLFNPDTADENCRSVQTILTHVVNSGYGYATSIHNLQGHNSKRPVKIYHFTTSKYLSDLDEMFSFTEKVCGLTTGLNSFTLLMLTVTVAFVLLTGVPLSLT